MSKRYESHLIELPVLLSKMALDTGLSIGLSLARLAQITTRSLDNYVEKYVELMEGEIKVNKEKIKVE